MFDYEKIKAKRMAVIESYFSTDAEETWLHIEPIFRAEARVYEGHAGRSWLCPLPFDLMQTYVERFPDACEKILAKALYHTNAQIVAYALIGLEMAESRLLENLPSSVLGRKEPLETVLGCFVVTTSLGEFAIEKQKDALEMKVE